MKVQGILAILFLLSVIVSCKYSHIVYQTTEDTIFLGRFTFNEGDVDTKSFGQLVVQSNSIYPQYDSFLGQILLNLYTEEQFNQVWYDDSLSCEVKVAGQHPLGGNYGEILNGTETITKYFDDSGITTWLWTGSDCALREGQFFKLDIEFHWTNPGGWWYEEFSVEDQGLITIYLVFLIFWVIFAPVVFVLIYICYTKNNHDLDYNLIFYCLAVLFQVIGLGLYVIHYFTYAGNGVGIPGFLVAGDVFSNINAVFVMLIAVQVASLSNEFMQMNYVIRYVIGTILGMYFGFFLWQEIYSSLNPEEVVYKWDCPPGIVMAVLQVLVCGVFIAVSFHSMLKNRERKLFIIIFAVVYSIWMLTIPIVFAIAQAAPFVERWKTVLAVYESVNLLCFIFFLLLVIPNPISKKINVMSFSTSHKRIASKLVVEEHAFAAEDDGL